MKKLIKFLLIFLSVLYIFWFAFSLDAHKEVQKVLTTIAADSEAGDKIPASNPAELIKSIGKNIMMPIIVVIWILLAFIAFYKIALSDKEDERKSWKNYLLWGTIWVIIMTTAWFLTWNLVWKNWSWGILWAWQDYDPLTIANNLYQNIIKKFFVLAMYFIIWILFVILLINLIKFLSSSDKEDIQKHTKTIIVWNSIWIIFILFAKNIVEMFYSNMKNSTSLWSQSPILENKDLWWLATVLNYFLSFIAFIITVFIIYQSFLLLTKPDDEWTYKNLKKYFVYALLWVLLIWGVYIIANFFIVNN